ncbi:EAL domain-containing protein [Trinickia caryophylli]|uniref:EAL domain, c-di-GMP-specific phosphodiesterase class I (Or its enzymatically inactive variant) n=1 Tax=Trinickia caryophylli TaxID=28094 RepID=A0A1X7EBT3_TRICW|nr:EAL domain-containing protein [Trinickia caryophylli]PMS12954.1 EAL domain-containing protein [Trinickia caryophylli]TRX14717.1 EAL domain-containing protein [Trinickia caryophylli]WQE14560.1 EAL domain-containing protein [Trinickia caryophylli]SMF30777.1 EAL domain, c-di-GMP-specific phosphodiesterase class I (or its enzymatically inactive variant) [Trinickia caryophylli]GLU32030.1 EAL domain-containing protein [Trinickia caryophylli]
MSDVQESGLPLIESAFQPILSLAHGLPIGYEALLRASDRGVPCSPDKAFGMARASGRYGEYERACAHHHVRRFCRSADDESVLFLNVHPDVLVDPHDSACLVEDVLESGMAPSRVVLEILEAGQETTDVLADSVERLRGQGFRVALDDFGAGLTNLGRVWDLRPDIVKLDRELIWKAAASYRNARSLLRLVDLLHDIGTLIVIEGIETEAQAMLSFDCDADFVQGYFFAMPAFELAPPAVASPAAGELGSRLSRAHKLRHVADIEELGPYRKAFARVKRDFCAGRDIAESARHFFALEWGQRVFVLDEEGCQAGETIESDRRPPGRDVIFPLLARRVGANWSKRPYFRHALFRPGQIAISDPYVSSSSRALCVTFSVYVSRGGGGCVLCADVLFDELSAKLR